ncbi:MAG: ABC transporter permease [Saprospiraceae bacterium]
MLQNHLKIAFRNLLKNKGFSFINLFGLTVGLACCMLIGLYIWNELSFDRYHKNADRIYRVSREFITKDGSQQLHLGHLAPPFAPLLKNDFPDIEEAVRLFQTGVTFRKGDQLYSEENFFLAEPVIFNMFDIPLVSGNPETALNDPFTLLLSESAAKKYFNTENPVDQTMTGLGRYDFKITGVFRDFPYNSHFHPSILASFSTLRDSTIYGEEGLRTNWGNNSFSTFLLLPKGYPAKSLEAQFPAFIDKNMAGYYGQEKTSDRTRLHLMPLTDIHLHSHLDSEIEENGDINRVYIFAIIAALVLLIACINYMNLSTARSTTRAKEIGVRKVVGAGRGQIAWQFLSESILLSLLATVLAVMLVQLALPFVNHVLGQQLQVTAKMLAAIPIATLGMALITGVLAGFYPAIFISGMKPLHILKSGGTSTFRGPGGSGGGLRKVLVTGQFAISVGLIIATIVVYNQLDFMQNKDIGLDKDHVVTLNFYQSLAPRFEGFRNEILANTAIRNMARSSRIPSGRLLDSYGSAEVQTASDSLEKSAADLKTLTIDHRFVPTYNLGVAAGRNYREDQGTDRTGSFMLNEAGAKSLGWPSPEDAVGKRIRYGGRDAHIVGILKDFNFESLHQPIQPMIMFIPSDSTNFNYLSVKLDGSNIPGAIAHLEKVWKEFLPQFPFEYQFIDEEFGALYQAEQRQGRMFIGFALLAILVACLGLFGLTAFVTQQRVKEIGIRKVLGATTAGLVGLLSKDFLKLVVVSLVIASPLAYYFMNKWLADFAYRIDISWWVFAVAGIMAVGVAFLTVSFQSVKAALANPVKSLRSE